MSEIFDTFLNGSIKQQLQNIRNTQRAVDVATQRLSTGKTVNGALDNPQNYFASESLNNRAADLERLLDNIGQSNNAINAALTGADRARDLLNLAISYTDDLRTSPLLGSETSIAGTPLNQQILSENPDAYWRLNETAGTAAINYGSLGGVQGTYTNGPALGQAAIYSNGGDVTPNFNGTNQRVNIPDSSGINLGNVAQRSIEMTFNADTVAGRQVLWEEGATVNAMSIYLDNGRIYFQARDAGDFGPFDISAPVNAGETYHAALVFDSTTSQMRGYVNGVQIPTTGVVTQALSPHSGDIAIGGQRGGNWYHNGSSGAGSAFFFDGRIADVALYNRVLSDNAIRNHAETLESETVTNGLEETYNAIMNQLDELIHDSSYRGTNLLGGDTLTTFFNETRSSYLTTEGQTFTSSGLDLDGKLFNSIDEIDATQASLREALQRIETFERTLTTDVNVIQTRSILTNATINTLETGSDKLVLADLNEESAKLLALQTRQQIQFGALSNQPRNVLDEFFN